MAFAWYKTATTSAAQSGSTDSTNYPLTISLDGNVQAADADFKTVANGGFVQNSNGYDIRPYADAALTSALPYELVFYDGTTGKLEMHVKIPTLSHTSNVPVYMAFGDATISTNGSSTSTWDSFNKGVYHFPNGTTLSTSDSTSNANNVVTNNGGTAVSGKIDGGIAFSANNQYEQMLPASTYTPSTAFTVEFWGLTSIATARNLSFQTNAGSTVLGMNFGINGSGTVVSDGKMYGWYRDSGNALNAVAASSATNNGAWHHYALVISGSNVALYVDGSSVAAASNVSTANTFAFGNGGSTFSFGGLASFTSWVGSLDELRVSITNRSADWLLANYNSQKNSSTFLTWGAKTSTATASSITGISSTTGAVSIQF